MPIMWWRWSNHALIFYDLKMLLACWNNGDPTIQVWHHEYNIPRDNKEDKVTSRG